VPDDELERWARGRAPELIARAEEQAVAELARALVDAALAGRKERASAKPAAASVPPAREPVRPEPEAGTGLWAYCVARADVELTPEAAPVHPGGVLERVVDDGLAALVSRVPMSEFGSEALTRNLNELDWLERVARAHEAVLERALEAATIVPLRLCTIFRDADGVRRMLREERAELDAALRRLDGREEWGVKLLVDRDALQAAARGRSPDAGELERQLEGSSEGEAYMLRRRLERESRDAADRLGGELAEDVHARLQDWADAAVLSPPQNRELSGHEGEMLLNAAYLVPSAKVGRLRELVDELVARHRELGIRIELTGPWPPYNFVTGRTTTEAAPA
jgi:Gas vesicle synthesis protein GvpL/GvpF